MSPIPTKRVLITGATGLIGKKLSLRLFQLGYEIHALTRDIEKARGSCFFPIKYFEWHPEREPAPAKAFENVDTVIHLAGESVASSRWTSERKKKILKSRVIGTRNLVSTLTKLSSKPKVLISSSAIGIYGNRGVESLNEESELGTGFLANVCKKWEEEALKAESSNIRTVILRTGIVLDPDGGALAQMLPIFRLGLGGPISDGQSWMSWIHIDDLVEMIVFSATNPNIKGPINGVSPEACTNKEFTKALSKSLGMPAFFPVPSMMLKIVFGEMSDILLASQKLTPNVALKNSFKFEYKNIQSALDSLINTAGKGSHRLKQASWIPKDKNTVFNFFAEAENLESITPPWLNFKITHKSEPQIKSGLLLDYQLKIRKIPLRWRTLIEDWQPTEHFVDKQIKGPYSLWVHRHTFTDVRGGTLVEDTVDYKLPFGPLGQLAHSLFVKSDLSKIFNYRARVILEKFK
jgi:uncharacterized protein (TIGR01777 family)